MNQGYFFQLEKNSSQADGTVVFRYLGVKAIDKDEIRKYAIPEYPIYLVIKSTAIDFYFHGISQAENDVNKLAENKSSQTSKENHVNIRILHLPLSKNIAVKDNLTSNLINCYNLEYKINKIYTSKFNDEVELNKRIVYSNLEVFNSEKSDDQKDSVISFKRLFLDFLFDLEHSKVFENSPHYEEAEIHLVENLFFHYLANKAAFYYEWEQYLSKETRNERMVYVHSLKEKERQWAESCLDNRSPLMFEESQGWFESVEDEMKQVLFRRKRREWVKQLIEPPQKETTVKNSFIDYKAKIKKIEKENSKLLINSSKWFLRRYNFDDAISCLLLLFLNRFLIAFLFVFLVIPFCLFLFAQKRFFYEPAILKILILLSIPTILTFLKFLSKYKIKKNSEKKTASQLPLFTLLNSIGWIIFILLFDFLFWGNFNGFPESLDGNKIYISIALFLFIALIMFFIIKGIFLTIVSIVLPRLIIGLFGAWFFILTTEELVLANFDRLLEWQDILLLVLLALIMLFFIMNQIKSVNKADLSVSYLHHAIKLLDRSLAFLMFSFFISLVIGQLSINIFAKKTISRSEYLETFFKEVPLEQCDDSIKATVKELQTGKLKISEDICREQLFDLLRNVYGHKNKNISSDKILFISSLSLPLTNYKLPLIIFPRMLIFLAVFALFFGVFIQLIFEEKPVSEPL